MKVFRYEILKIFVFFSLILLSGQAVLSQKKKCGGEFSYSEILSRFTARRTSSAEPVNRELIVEISKRKIGFILDAANEQTLRDASASDLLIKTIRENVPPELNEVSDLYELYRLNYESNDAERLKTAMDAAKEFIRKFENNECYAAYVGFYKEAVEMISLYIRFLSNYESDDVQKLNAALEAAKEFVRKFEKNEAYTKQVTYFKEEAIPTLIDTINAKNQSDSPTL